MPLYVDIIIWAILVAIISACFVMLYFEKKHIKNDIDERLTNLVNNINNAQYYEYTYDKQQETNIRNVDKNVAEVYAKLKQLQENVKYMSNTSISKADLVSNVDTNNMTAATLAAKNVTVANNTSKNNLVFEGGRTSDGANEGWAAINFNGN